MIVVIYQLFTVTTKTDNATKCEVHIVLEVVTNIHKGSVEKMNMKIHEN